MRVVHAAALLCLLLPAAALASSVVYAPPVAVLPFKNLNDDPETDWLKLGISETMLTDLKRSGAPVVERGQIDKALGELLLQDAGGAEDATAVKVGRLVGAKTVVLGSFQEAGKQIRINARFVEVETGVVLGSAKTTGPTERVFALQDEIVAKLLGKAPAARPKPKEPVKTVQAYKLYAMSLATSSDADRVGLLKKSLTLDPSFVYAAEELAALERRLAEYAKQRASAGASLDKSTLAMLADPAVAAQEKQWRAGQLLTRHLGERKCRAAVADAQRILELDLPDPEPAIVGANESALSTMVICYRILKQDDLALQAGEKLLKRFPAGAWYKHTETQVTAILDWRKGVSARASKIDARFAELEAKRTADRVKREKKDANAAAERGARLVERNIDLERCWFPRFLDWERVVTGCREFREKYASDPDAAQDLRHARSQELEALGELGRWEEVIPAARAFVEAGPPDGVGVSNLRSYLEYHWPRDAVP